MENASDYISELNLDATTRIVSIYTLGLDGVANNDALFSLSKFGKTIDTTVASEGYILSLDYENGEEGLNFRVTHIFDAQGNSAVWLEDVISASTDELNLAVDGITLNPSYYQEEDMDIRFSVNNMGGIRYTGMPEITISTYGDSKTINQELKAPQKQGSQTLTVAVRILNPAVTTLSADLQEDNGICVTVSIGSPFPAELVDSNTTAVVRVYKVVENGKTEVYSRDVPVTGSTFNIGMAYDEFYRSDGQYVVTVNTDGMQDSEFFEIMSQDFASGVCQCRVYCHAGAGVEFNGGCQDAGCVLYCA